MLRMKPVKDHKKAEAYYAITDGGYYAGVTDLRREWIGSLSTRLGLSGTPEFEQFSRLLQGLDPQSGEQLTAKLIDGRIAAWDVTASVPKGVTIARERGDDRITDLVWQADRLAMRDLEAYVTTRVRVDGKQEDRVTGNLIAYSQEHADTRPVEDKSLPENHPWRLMPDPDFHIHNVVSNLTFDAVEDKFKAIKFRPIMDLRKFFDRRFDHHLAGLLAEAGYEIETKWKPDGKYHTWDIKGIPASVVEKNSRRSGEIEDTEAGIIAERKAVDETAPDHLSAVERDKLGATSRNLKRDDLTLAECREYWDSRITPDESDAIAETIRRAREGLNPKPPGMADQAVAFALLHHGEQESVFRLEHLQTTAMERSMGSATPAEIEAAVHRAGVIVREIDGKKLVTTRELQAEEDFVVALAARGQGTVRPVGLSPELERGKLNDGQWTAVTGLLETQNRVSLLQGAAGVGKTSMLATYEEGLRLASQSATYLATTAAAVKVLQKDGFEANTLARFLVDEKMQAAAKGGRVVVDESSMLGHQDAYRLFNLVERLNLKLILVGDPMQHGSVGRGATMRLLTQYAGLQPFRLTQILRQKDPAYLAAATLLSEGKAAEGFDALDNLGWVEELGDDAQRYQAIAADYVQALTEPSPVKPEDRVLLVSPTHAEAAHITEHIRCQLREGGKLGGDEHTFTRLVAVDASEAERSQASTYREGMVLQFHQKATGGFESGQRITVTDPAKLPLDQADKFQLYRPEIINLAEGDLIRFTASVKTRDGKHTLRNGETHRVTQITKGGNLRLDNGWLVGKDAGHFRYGYVDTSFSSQGKTVKRAILAMSSESLPATNAEQLYVSSSRAWQRMTLYTDDKESVRDAIQESSQKLVALDLREEKPAAATGDRLRKHLERLRRMARIERQRDAWMTTERHYQQERQASRGR